MEFEYYNQAADILNDLILEGAFGVDAKVLAGSKSQKSTGLHLYDCLLNIFKSNNSYGIENSVGITFRLLDFYIEALNVKPEETSELLLAFLKGTKTNPELENLSSYTEWLQSNLVWKESVLKIQSQGIIGKSDIMKSTSALLSSYSKGVELIGKLFTILIAIAKIINSSEFDLIQISSMTLNQKLKMFEKVTDEKHHILTTTIDRHIRNADSHLNASYSTEKKAFIMKRNVKKGKINEIEIFEIELYDMLLIIYPKVGWMVQGFICSCILLVLSKIDQKLFKEATQVLISKCSVDSSDGLSKGVAVNRIELP